jgi:hypothetical protein
LLAALLSNPSRSMRTKSSKQNHGCLKGATHVMWPFVLEK